MTEHAPPPALLRSLVCFLLGLPLVIVVISLADPFLAPVRASALLRKLVYALLCAWMIAVSARGMGLTFARQAREMQSSAARAPGCLSSLLMAANGLVLLLAAVMCLVMLVRG